MSPVNEDTKKALQEVISKATFSGGESNAWWLQNSSVGNERNYGGRINAALSGRLNEWTIPVTNIDTEVYCCMSPAMAILFVHCGFDKNEHFCSHLQPKINAGTTKIEEMNTTLAGYLTGDSAHHSSQKPQVVWYTVKRDAADQASNKRAVFTDTIDNPMYDDMSELELLENDKLSIQSCCISDLLPFYQLLRGVSVFVEYQVDSEQMSGCMFSPSVPDQLLFSTPMIPSKRGNYIMNYLHKSAR
jgi:hypothetical protein